MSSALVRRQSTKRSKAFNEAIEMNKKNLSLLKDEYGLAQQKEIEKVNIKLAKFVDSWDEVQLPSRQKKKEKIPEVKETKADEREKRRAKSILNIQRLERESFRKMLLKKPQAN